MTRTLIVNADIRTMDEARPRAHAMLIVDGIIRALGDDLQAPPETEVIDAGGRLCLPGFQDAHIHLLNGGTDLVQTAQLYECTTLGQIQTILRAHAATWPGPMIWGAGWQNGFFGDANLTRHVLDAAVPDRPCLIYDGNFHNACVNTRALEMACVTRDTPDPGNGHILRDAAGQATGMLHEDAIYWMLDFLPETTDATYAEGLRAGQAQANLHGITGIIDPQILDHHARIYGATDLTLRVAGAMHVSPEDTEDTMLARLLRLRRLHPGPDLHLNAAKFFLDGGLENRTAALLAPYADAPGGNADLMFDPDQIRTLFTALDAHRFQIHVHCIGDAATRAALDGFAAARQSNGPWPSLHQIAHCQLVHPDDRARFRDLGVMANLQPLWACTDPVIPDDTQAMIGADRAPWTYANRALIDAGAPFCINSDWAVTTLNPWEIIGTAITREPPRHRGRAAPFFPSEAMTIREAVQGYTINAAAACWRAHHTGRLRPGFSADAILIDRDIFTCDPYAVAETTVDLTLFKGCAVHRSSAMGG